MLEKLEQKGIAAARSRADAERRRLAAAVTAMGAEHGVAAHVEGEAIVLSGRALRQRLVIDPTLRWLIWEARNG